MLAKARETIPGPGALPRHRRYPTFFDVYCMVLAFSLGDMGALGRI